MNVKDVMEVWIDRMKKEDEAKRQRENDIFFNACLREINGEDAYHYLIIKASKIMNTPKIPLFVNYYFENKEHFDCSFEEWLVADNGPLYRNSIRGLFPELEVITHDEYEIMKMANEYYGLDLHMDPCDEFIYAYEFNFKELNEKRVNMDEIKDEMKNLILQKLNDGE